MTHNDFKRIHCIKSCGVEGVGTKNLSLVARLVHQVFLKVRQRRGLLFILLLS